jgi:hypothetical protein
MKTKTLISQSLGTSASAFMTVALLSQGLNSGDGYFALQSKNFLSSASSYNFAGVFSTYGNATYNGCTTSSNHTNGFNTGATFSSWSTPAALISSYSTSGVESSPSFYTVDSATQSTYYANSPAEGTFYQYFFNPSLVNSDDTCGIDTLPTTYSLSFLAGPQSLILDTTLPDTVYTFPLTS